MAKIVDDYTIILKFDGSSGDLKQGRIVGAVIDDTNSDLRKPLKKELTADQLETVETKTVSQISTFVKNKIEQLEGIS